MTIATGPCLDWPFEDRCCSLPEDTPQAVIDAAITNASQLLWAFSGRRWGPSCEYEIRPCRKSCLDGYPLRVNWGYSTGPYTPYMGVDGLWRNASPCSCSSDCACGELCEIRLEGPVFDIVSINEGGTVLDPSQYRIDNGSRLVRTDGECWPECQDLAAAPGEPDTLTVTYRVGLPLDAAARYAFSALVCHLVKECTNGCGCNLSARQNVSRVSRQGITMDLNTNRDGGGNFIFEEQRTGILEVDRWLAAVNPYRLTSPSRVMSPDARPQRITTWTGP